MNIDRRTMLTGGTSLAVAALCSEQVLAGEAVKTALPQGAIVLLAQLQAKEGEEEAVGKALLAMVAPTRKEAGCLCYNLHQAKQDKSQFMFYEQWASKEALAVTANRRTCRPCRRRSLAGSSKVARHPTTCSASALRLIPSAATR